MISKLVLSILIGSGVLILQGIMLYIARFYERTAGTQTGYQIYWISIGLTLFSFGLYITRIIRAPEPGLDFVGEPVANIAMLLAGIILIILSNRLYGQMMKGGGQ